MALARLDSAAAWLLLTTALRAHPAAPPPPPPPPTPTTGIFPPLPTLCPPPPPGTVPAGLRECSAGRLAAMLAQVEKMKVHWQDEAGDLAQ